MGHVRFSLGCMYNMAPCLVIMLSWNPSANNNLLIPHKSIILVLELLPFPTAVNNHYIPPPPSLQNKKEGTVYQFTNLAPSIIPM